MAVFCDFVERRNFVTFNLKVPPIFEIYVSNMCANECSLTANALEQMF